ncbi:SAP domain-containing protein [Candidatus Dependentiae bacterium]|nr:SAP domain-containing protein [Candidatus Dependentiae bacterium]
MSFEELRYCFCFLYVNELKDYCEKLKLSIKGKKIILIERIIFFLKTGQKLEILRYPDASFFKGKKDHIITPDHLILKGLYKNDFKTRLFFKSLIGDHFHFTVFGLDWLEKRWIDGNPATYKEFADMWQKEYEFRKIHKVPSKEEWAYINCIKKYLEQNPGASRHEMISHWEKERNFHKMIISKCMMKYL